MTQQEALQTYEAYVEAWKPIADTERQSIVSTRLANNLEYLAPEYVGGTAEAIQDMERFQRQYPGAYFIVGNISFHHHVALFQWVLVLPDGKVSVKGHDCVRFSSEGKIQSLLTFGPASPKL